MQLSFVFPGCCWCLEQKHIYVRINYACKLHLVLCINWLWTIHTQFIYKLYIIFIFKYRKSLSIFMLHVLIYSYCFSAFYFHLIIYAATLSTQDIQTSLILLDNYRAGHCGDGLMTFYPLYLWWVFGSHPIFHSCTEWSNKHMTFSFSLLNEKRTDFSALNHPCTLRVNNTVPTFSHVLINSAF